MCIHLSIQPFDGRSKPLDGSRLSRASGLTVESLGRGALGLSPSGECSCGFATGDPTSGDWTVRSDLIEPLVKAFEDAACQAKRFRLTVSWMDEPVSTERAVTLDQLIERVRKSSIARTGFVVRSS